MTAPEPLIYHDGDVALHGQLTRPAGPGNGRAVLVVHEADGIGGNVRRRCAMLAELGYVALAADMHGGGRVLGGEEMARAIGGFLADPAAFRRRVGAGLGALATATGFAAGRLAAIGYCFGGAAVLELARGGAAVAAVVSFHGLLGTRAPAAPETIRARILAATGARDPLVPLDQVAAFSAEMDAAAADWQLIVYGRALHSFTNPGVADLGDPRMAYDAQADAQSWAATLHFLNAALA